MSSKLFIGCVPLAHDAPSAYKVMAGVTCLDC